MSCDSATGCKPQILVVDDTPDNLRLLSAILTKQDYEVRKALNGFQALSSIKADAPNLILLDIKMPDMNGFEVCEILKQDPETCDIPIIFISALSDALDKVQAFSVGGTDYITKPFQEAEVLVRIENQLKLQALQQQLKDQNQALAQTNQALEEFSYVVAHDLQQPLQSIQGYARVMTLQYPELLDTAVNDYITKILVASGRMQELIQHLLNYAHIGKQSDDVARVDCNRALSQALQNLDIAIKESEARVSHDQLPVVWGNSMQLVQLFQNLINNAIKFSRPDTPPTISITVQEKNGDWLFQVQDNGIGISPDHLTNIFETFQRIDSKEIGAIPGSGIGLAICKKTVESHGGQIWVTSEPGLGTTFSFVLPRLQEMSQFCHT